MGRTRPKESSKLTTTVGTPAMSIEERAYNAGFETRLNEDYEPTPSRMYPPGSNEYSAFVAGYLDVANGHGHRYGEYMIQEEMFG